ncbi:hypothetical protein [Luteibacter sp.]|uniref:hypothetical protein n=1 Tax=Luteibacter sp. TaxID=1886636 RepID=UPI002808F9DF|nr:hypothetical protein [Luteibacter sp.]MDQ8051057.1 hypothetical protein [Luteibacter sp.]
MATASVVELARKSTPGAASRHRGPESGVGLGAVLQFPRRQTFEEIVRERIILQAQWLPHIYPGGLPRNLETDVAEWVHVLNICGESQRATFVRTWLADIAKCREDLENGWTSTGRIGDPKAEAYWHQCCVRSYGEPDEGHEAWLPWLAQHAEAGCTP